MAPFNGRALRGASRRGSRVHACIRRRPSHVRQPMMQTSQSSTASRGAPSPLDVKAGQLKAEFRDRGRIGSDGALLLWSTDALDLVNHAADEGVPILTISVVAPAGKAADAALDHRA